MMSDFSNFNKTWRDSAARVVEELFPVTSQARWDDLLDLRHSLLREDDWRATLRSFVLCREELEADHYLPFYRLRCLLCAHLRFEGVEKGELRKILRRAALVRAFLQTERRLVEA